MSLAWTRRMVAASGALLTIVAAAALWQFGGPGEARREERDNRRQLDLQAIAEAIACHVAQGAEGEVPARLAEISPACLSPDRAAQLVDPLDGSAYRIDYPAQGTVRICATFEGPPTGPRFVPRSLDHGSGCLTVPLRAA
jgi:hypothetical protein